MSTTLLLKAGDISINSGGKAETISGFSKSNQDVATALLQRFDPTQNFGSDLADIEAPLFGALVSLEGIIGQKVLQAVDRLMALQRQDMDRIGPDERIERVTSVRVNKLSDSVSYRFILEVQVASGDTLLRALELDMSHQLPDSLEAQGSAE